MDSSMGYGSDSDPGRTFVLFVGNGVEPDHAAHGLADPLTRVTVCAGLVEAVRIVRSARVDVLVTAGHLDRGELIALARAMAIEDPDLPIVALSRHGDALTAAALGVFRCVTPHADPSVLREAVVIAANAHRLAKLRKQAAALTGSNVAIEIVPVGLDSVLDAAIDGLWLAVQPIVRASSGEIFAYEALMRTPSELLRSPPEVLDVAEQLGRVWDVGRAVRARAASLIRAWHHSALLFVNLHPADLSDPELHDDTAPLAEASQTVVFEITERTSIERVEHASEGVERLRRRGMRIAVDDLGSGYSGLNSIARLEPEFVKIDMALVRGLDTDKRRQKLVTSMTAVCHDLGIQVVAEGIETMPERVACSDAGVDFLQGYLIARPGPPFPSVAW